MMATSGGLCARCYLALFAGQMAQSDDWREIAIVLIDATKEPEPEVVVAIACSQSGYFEEHR
jgi:hypothetical protein